MKKKFFYFFLFILFTVKLYSYDILYTADGEEYQGELLYIDTDVIKINIKDKEQIFERTKVNKLRIGDISAEFHINEIQDTILQDIFNYAVNYDTNIFDYTILYEEEKYQINKNNQNTITKRIILKIHTEEGKEAAANSIFYNILNETVVLNYARAINPDGIIYPISKTNIEYSDIYSQTPEYNKIKELKFVIKKVDIGTILDYSYTTIQASNNPANNNYTISFFQSKVPILEKKLIIECDDKENLFIKKENYNRIQFEESEINNENFYQYIISSKNIKELKEESLLCPDIEYIPYIMFSYNYGWSELKKFIKSKNQFNNDEIKNSEILNNFSNEQNLENIKKIYDYVAKEIKIVNVPININNYEHLSFEKINKIKYGNQYDKNYLLYLILKYFGYDVDLLLVKDNNEGLFIKEIPSLQQFNSVIVKLQFNYKVYYLNPIKETYPFAYLSFIYDNVIALNITDENILFETIKINSLEQEKIKYSLECEINQKGDLIGSGQIIYNGSSNIFIKNIKYLNNEERKRSLIKIITKLFEKTPMILESEIKYLEEKEKPSEINFKFMIKNFCQNIQNRYLIFKMPLLNFSASEVSEKEREYPLYFNEIKENEIIVKIKIPYNYEISYLPESIELSLNNHYALIDFKFINDYIEYHQSYIVNNMRADKDYYYKYKEFMEKLSRLSQDRCVLKTK